MQLQVENTETNTPSILSDQRIANHCIDLGMSFGTTLHLWYIRVRWKID